MLRAPHSTRAIYCCPAYCTCSAEFVLRTDQGTVSLLSSKNSADMAEKFALTWSVVVVSAATTAGVSLLLLLSLVAVSFALDATARRRRRSRGEEEEGRSGIYAGRVWHVRFKPTVHRFSYPIFYCLVDLDELDVAFPWYLWPIGSARLPALARFRPADHLKGKEKRAGAGGTKDDANDNDRANAVVAGGGRGMEAPGVSTSKSTPPLSHHADRVRDIVQEATGARPAGRIQLLTHLAYLGYCFNPVSFYYCLDATEKEIETVVAEVSNTPWGEMHCYVLNAKTGGVEVISGGDVDGPVRYRRAQISVDKFEKDFHVSPFMSMKHTYDWKFTAPDVTPGSGLTAQTTMLEPDTGKVFFDAKLVLKRQPQFSAAALCWHMTAYPLYTVWMQVVIHYQAFRLWWKQVPFFPHPEGAETAASRLVAVIMTPLFKAQAAWDEGAPPPSPLRMGSGSASLFESFGLLLIRRIIFFSCALVCCVRVWLFSTPCSILNAPCRGTKTISSGGYCRRKLPGV
ncbi:unnamed protein product [Pylaiella littoralis]